MATAAQKSTSNGSSTSAATEKSMKDLETELAVLRSDISEITSTIRDLGRSGVSDLNNRARATASDLKARGAAQARRAGDNAAAAYSSAEDTVRQNPAASVGIAAGVGFVVGLFLARRH